MSENLSLSDVFKGYRSGSCLGNISLHGLRKQPTVHLDIAATWKLDKMN